MFDAFPYRNDLFNVLTYKELSVLKLSVWEYIVVVYLHLQN